MNALLSVDETARRRRRNVLRYDENRHKIASRMPTAIWLPTLRPAESPDRYLPALRRRDHHGRHGRTGFGGNEATAAHEHCEYDLNGINPWSWIPWASKCTWLRLSGPRHADRFTNQALPDLELSGPVHRYPYTPMRSLSRTESKRVGGVEVTQQYAFATIHSTV